MSKLSKLWHKTPMAHSMKKIEKGISNAIPHTHSAQRRAEMYAAREQLDLYRSQKDLLEKESSRINEERDNERKRLHEKQIRSLRRQFRSPGFMEGPNTGTTDTLG